MTSASLFPACPTWIKQTLMCYRRPPWAHRMRAQQELLSATSNSILLTIITTCPTLSLRRKYAEMREAEELQVLSGKRACLYPHHDLEGRN